MKNMHGVEIRPVEERIQDLRSQIRNQLEKLTKLNESDGNIGEACVELAALHGMWSRKHVLLKQARGRMDLDKYAVNEG